MNPLHNRTAPQEVCRAVYLIKVEIESRMSGLVAYWTEHGR